MAAIPFQPERIVSPPFVKPYLQTLDRIRQPTTLRPDQLTDRARALLADRAGPSDRPVEATFAHGAVGLLCGHTHYFDGFAMLMPLAHGTAVALRRTEAPRSMLTFEGSDDRWSFDCNEPPSEAERRDWPGWVCLVEAVIRQLGGGGTQVEGAVVSTVQAGCTEAYLAALGVAATRAVLALFARPDPPAGMLPAVYEIMAACTGLPFSIAYLIAAEAAQPPAFTLVDTATREHLPVDAPPPEALGWGLVDVGSERLHKAASHWQRKTKADKALALLQKRGFEQLATLRDLEHRDLQRALGVLPRRLKPLVRHLVTENRRVHKMVFAARNGDWQMIGALLLMSHASLRTDWQHTNDAVDFVVEQVEAMSLEGLYGASVTGRGGCVLVVGQPFAVPRGLDRIKAAFEARFGRLPETLLL